MKKIISICLVTVIGSLFAVSANAQLASESPAMTEAQVKKIMTVKKTEPAKVQVASQQPASQIPAADAKQTEVKKILPPVSNQGGVIPSEQLPASEKLPAKKTEPVEEKQKSTK